MATKKESSDGLLYFMFLCPFFTGLAQHYQTLFAGLVLLGFLFVHYLSKGKIIIYKNSSLYCGGIIGLCALLSLLWGESKGDSFYGFLRITVMLLFLVVLMQYPKKEREEVRSFVPLIGAIMTVVSAVMYLFPGLSEYVFVNNRLAGFFQYPNTFALFLLLGLYLFMKEEEVSFKQPKSWILPLILMVGLLWSGSRITFVMMVGMILVLMIRYPKTRKTYLPILGIMVIFAALYLTLSGNVSSIGRFLTIGTKNSTLIGRLLYDKDALRMILKRPYGYGYLGYYLVQQTMQTGVYTVRFCHNDWLQTALDYGVLALIAFAAGFVFALKKGDATSRGGLLLIGLHMLLEFDLQFSYLVFVLLFFLDVGEGKTFVLERKKPVKGETKNNITLVAVSGISVCFMAVFLWMGTADLLSVRGAFELSHNLYPWAADTEMHAMAKETDLEKQNTYANHLISKLSYCGVAYDVRSMYEESKGEYLSAVEDKRQAVLYQKYNIEKYMEYQVLLEKAMDFYRGSDEESYEICKAYEEEIHDMLLRLEEDTDPLAFYINDKPVFRIE